MAEKRDTPLSEAELDTLFAAADAEAPLPSGDLMARILAEAEAAQVAPFVEAPRRSWWAGITEALGGAAGLTGLGAAVATGLVVGIFPPEALTGYADTLTGADAYFSDYVPGLEASFDG